MGPRLRGDDGRVCGGDKWRVLAMISEQLRNPLSLFDNKGELDEVAAEVREVGGEVESIVRRPDSLEDAKAMLDAALKRFGGVDQLVVASGMNKPGFIQDLAYEDWQA